MIDNILKRFRGSASYEKGVEHLIFCNLKSNGLNQPITLTQKSPLLSTQSPIPILAINRKDKFVLPYEDEYEFSFLLNYINQDDVSKKAVCTIKEYAGSGQDFRIYMQDKNDFVKSITSVEPRTDEFIADLSHIYTFDEFRVAFNNALESSVWNVESDQFYDELIEEESDHLKISLSNITEAGISVRLFTDNVIEQYKGLNSDTINKAMYAYNSLYNSQVTKIGSFKIQLAINNTNGVFLFALYTNKGLMMHAFSPNSAFITSMLSMGISGTVIPASDTLSEYTLLQSDLPVINGLNEPTIETMYPTFWYGSADNSISTSIIRVGNIDYIHDSGNIGDEVDIFGMIGNIAKIEGAFSLGLSDVAYNLRIASLQKYTKAAFKNGLNRLMDHYKINISYNLPPNVARLYLQLFSSFIVPNQEVMQESMEAIIKVIDPNGSVIVSAEYSEYYYKMVVDFVVTLPSIDEEDLAVLVTFENRYRPIPSIVEINLIFDNDYIDDIAVSESAIVDIGDLGLLFSPTLKFSTSSIFRGPSTDIRNLPTDYP
jgi:hypothetical protein